MEEAKGNSEGNEKISEGKTAKSRRDATQRGLREKRQAENTIWIILRKSGEG